jgi:hypothetical protein
VNKKKLFQKILNNTQNISFNDFISVVEAFGFYLARVNGSHHIFKNNKIAKQINLQNVNGEAKPYQIKQFLAIVEENNLFMEE